MSSVRKNYFFRLAVRCVIFLFCLGLCFAAPSAFDVLEGMNFFGKFSVLHLFWGIWMFDMVLQIIPIKNKLPLGSQKLFSNRFRPIREKINYKALKKHIVETTKAAYKVMILWALLIAVIGIAYFSGWINKQAVFMIAVAFYVCDLICVLVWCPFRLIMKNKCCTTCRIFNWDHLMMFSPLIFLGGAYCGTLVAFAILAWLVWEVSIMLYPERFSETTNAALKCSECTDKLCTQYCQKLR